ncbi:MAG: hypothetical protein ACYC64_08295 [Armatimonadota bacterium]
MNRTLFAVLVLAFCNLPALAAPAISGLTVQEQCSLYGKIELSFEVATVGENLYWPFDETPNPGVPARVGVSVDGLFSSDNWNTTIVQPGFFCQEFTDLDSSGNKHTIGRNGYTWAIPLDRPKWKVRFAPTLIGQWKYKIRVVDASGTTITPEYPFTCTPSANHGFVRVSSDDTRYFELSDGTYVPFIGLAGEGGSVAGFESEFPTLESMGINLVRTWWQSSNPSLALFGAGGQGGDLTWGGLEYSSQVVRDGRLISAKINPGRSISSFAPCEPNKNYRFSVTVKTVDLTGSGDYGFRLGIYPTVSGEKRTTHLVGSNDWRQVSLDFQTGATHWSVDYVVACIDGGTSGCAYVSDASLCEVKQDGSLGPELLMRTDFQAHTSYPQQIAWTVDKQLEIAQQHNVFIKAVIEEKGDSFFQHIQSDGTWGESSNNNVYASPTHASRTYQRYFWRYLIARYGYSTALHSVEFVNEGDPFNGYHTEATDSLGRFFDDNDPNHHLVSTSNWHSFPPTMWHSSDIDYADLHMYLGYAPASGGKRIWPGWDGVWWGSNNATDVGSGFEIDESIHRSGLRSLKITIPVGVEPQQGDTTQHYSNMYFQCGCKPGDNLRVSVWFSARDYVRPFNPQLWNEAQIKTYFCKQGGDAAIGASRRLLVPGGNHFNTDPTKGPVPDEASQPVLLEQAQATGTYDWREVTMDITAPAEAFIYTVQQPFYFATYGTRPAEVWIDDLVVENLTTGEVINYNGGFEYMDSESYDVVAGHCAYSRLCRSFQSNKPVIRGETAFTYPQRFTNPYKGFSFGGEDQLLIDETSGVWWRKWVWSHLDTGGLIEIYWFPKLLKARGYTFGNVYQDFVKDIPLSRGGYRDAVAQSTSPKLRVIGQKDLTNNRAHLWIDNAPYTWKNVVDGVSVPAVSGTVTVSGFKDGTYNVEWWDTSTGLITRTDEVPCSGGNIALNVQNLQSDVACKIYLKPAKIDLRILVPSTDVIPGQVVTVTVEYTNSGETDASNVDVSARVPAEMEYVPGSAEQSGGVWDSTAKLVTWIVDHVAAHQTGTKTFNATVK